MPHVRLYLLVHSDAFHQVRYRRFISGKCTEMRYSGHFPANTKETDRNAESERTKATTMRIHNPLAKFPQRFTCNLNLKFATFSFGARLAVCVFVSVLWALQLCAQLTSNRIHQHRHRTKRDGPKTIKSKLINLLNRITDVNEIQFAEALPNASYFAHLNPSWISIS